jgi:hypothetical protein
LAFVEELQIYWLQKNQELIKVISQQLDSQKG